MTTTSLEDQLRDTLRRNAHGPAPRGDTADVRRRVARRRRRRRVAPAVGAAAIVAGGILVVGRAGDDDRTSTAAEEPAPGAASDATVEFPLRADAPAFVELPGWQATYYVEIRSHLADGGTLADNEYQWSSDGKRLQLHAYDGGADAYRQRVDGDERSEVELFGRTASLLDYGNGRYRVDVLVGEYTLEFDGDPFADADEFLATVRMVRPTDVAPPAAITAAPIEVHLDEDGMPRSGVATATADTTVPTPTG
jgi:hypothetical protein